MAVRPSMVAGIGIGEKGLESKFMVAIVCAHPKRLTKCLLTICIGTNAFRTVLVLAKYLQRFPNIWQRVSFCQTNAKHYAVNTTRMAPGVCVWQTLG